jgi:hypothetical protein
MLVVNKRWHFSFQRPVSSFFVVPSVTAVDDHLGMVERIELITINHFPLDIRIQRLYVSIVLGRGHMGELLINAFLSEVFANSSGNEMDPLSFQTVIPPILYSSSISDNNTRASPFFMLLCIIWISTLRL